MEYPGKLSQKNSKNINYNKPQSDQNIRSQSKNPYKVSRHNKNGKINFDVYQRPKPSNNEKSNENIHTHKDKNNRINNIDKNTIHISNIEDKKDATAPKSEQVQIKLLKDQNTSMKKILEGQEEIIKYYQNIYLNQCSRIKDLKKTYLVLKNFIETNLKLPRDKMLTDKMEEELAIRAVEQQIIDELCPNPDKMSYEQLLELEDEVGSVSKGLKKDQINKIPIVPFRKLLFGDNSNCIICMDNFSENELVKKLLCGHIFHKDCIEKWLISQKTCPFCKEECI